MNADLIASRRGAHYAYSVHIDGLSTLMRFLKEADPQLRKVITNGLKEAAQPVLVGARANAMRIADDGTMAHSLSIRSYATGYVRLASTDEAAKVKEFARHGATYKPKPTDKRANARKMEMFPVGVPKGDPPRVMYRALDDNADKVIKRINAMLEEVLGGADG